MFGQEDNTFRLVVQGTIYCITGYVRNLSLELDWRLYSFVGVLKLDPSIQLSNSVIILSKNIHIRGGQISQIAFIYCCHQG